MRFLVDAQLPPRLCLWLEEKGNDALHVYKIEGRGVALPDSRVWRIARLQSRIILSKDFDFFDRALLFGKPPQTVHVNVGNCGNTELFQILSSHWQEVESALNGGATLVSLTKKGVDVFD